MGLNTAALILNDRLDSLRRPDAGEQIFHAIVDSRGDGWTPVGVTVLPSVHADQIQIVAIGGNTIQRLGYGHYRDQPEDLLRALADQMGFRLVKKPKPRAPEAVGDRVQDEPLPTPPDNP